MNKLSSINVTVRRAPVTAAHSAVQAGHCAKALARKALSAIKRAASRPPVISVADLDFTGNEVKTTSSPLFNKAAVTSTNDLYIDRRI